MSIRVNGLAHSQGPATAASRVMIVFDDEWDEDCLIGGKRLVGWMDEEEGKKEVQNLWRLLENMDQ